MPFSEVKAKVAHNKKPQFELRFLRGKHSWRFCLDEELRVHLTLMCFYGKVVDRAVGSGKSEKK